MIAKLTGAVDSVGEDWAVIDVNGVGYLVHCSTRTLARLPPAGGVASLLIETQVREDRIQLFGFADAAERDWLRLLSTVQGVGARTALAILSALATDELVAAIANGDKAPLTRAAGVGPKLAARIVVELKDRVQAPVAAMMPAAGAGARRQSAADAVSALINLGYREAEATGAVARAARALGADAPVEELIRAGLKGLSP
jgi:Holliday junction DNA helicase RuvA